MPAKKAAPLQPAELRRSFDPALVPFDDSSQAPQCDQPVLGQARAKEALEFGLAISSMDYHVYVAGPRQTGRTYLVRSLVERLAAGQEPPSDWIYVYNFKTPDEPKAVSLPQGMGSHFAKDMEKLVERLSETLPELFEGDDYSRRKESLVNGFKHRRSEVFQDLDKEAQEMGYALRFDQSGIMVTPADEDGNPLPESAIREMSDEAREELRKKSDVIQSMVTEALRQVNAREKELTEATKGLDREMVGGAAARLMEDLFKEYGRLEEVEAYLKAVREHLLENFHRLLKKEGPPNPFAMSDGDREMKEYRVNLFVDNSETKGAPVVVEKNPTFPNLFGRIERQAQFGALFTDFTLLRPGALHKANGGYLVLPVRELLMYYLPWQTLKRSLMERNARMEDIMEQLGYMVTRTLRPEPIPLNLKVILVGDRELYDLLSYYDDQFPKLFKVKAEMATRMDWGGEEIANFTDHLCQAQKRKNLLPLHRTGVARLIELAAELADDRERLTLQLAVVEDVLTESDFFAHKAGQKTIRAEDVEKALTERRRRLSMIEERVRERFTRGVINVETEGAVTGQINGLAVLQTGDYMFGIPGRISAVVGLGDDGVVDIEREAKLSGPFHTKGVLILGGFLRGRFGARQPLALSASLVFEQSYSQIDGDSASMAETLALLSRLAGVPLRQDLAITGSISQTGQAQAIGGVNQKIEGFFRLCRERGLTGAQGVVIPRANTLNLMLHQDIVEACRQKKFHIHAVDTVDDAAELFTGLKAGVRSKAGNYPRGSFNYLVEQELKNLHETARKLKKGKKDSK